MSSKPETASPRPEARPFPYAEATHVSAPGTPFFSGEGIAQEIARCEETARELGRRQGESEARALLEGEMRRARQAAAEMVSAFAREREAYYEKLEPEIVRLALGIARKILHREAQIDPLLLAGLVRVSLEAIEFSTQVRIRVYPSLIASWREYFALHIDPSDLPELVEDPTLNANRCVMETHLGKTELGWAVQLEEIERGLLDLLSQRPPASL